MTKDKNMKIGVDYVGITTPFYCTDGQGRILLHKRSKNCRDEHGMWDPGSGKLEFSLTPEENVLKEVLEEYGVEGEIIGKIEPQTILREFDGIKTHWLALAFFVKVNPAEAKNNEPEKIDEIGWFSLNNLPSPLHSGFKYSLEKFIDEFKSYIK